MPPISPFLIFPLSMQFAPNPNLKPISLCTVPFLPKSYQCTLHRWAHSISFGFISHRYSKVHLGMCLNFNLDKRLMNSKVNLGGLNLCFYFFVCLNTVKNKSSSWHFCLQMHVCDHFLDSYLFICLLFWVQVFHL